MSLVLSLLLGLSSWVCSFSFIFQKHNMQVSMAVDISKVKEKFFVSGCPRFSLCRRCCCSFFFLSFSCFLCVFFLALRGSKQEVR